MRRARSPRSVNTSRSASAVSDREMIAATGHTKNTPRNPSGIATRTTRHARRHCSTICVHSSVQVFRFAPIVVRRQRVRMRRLDRELPEHRRQLRARHHRIHVHLERHVLLERARQHEVDQRACARPGSWRWRARPRTRPARSTYRERHQPSASSSSRRRTPRRPRDQSRTTRRAAGRRSPRPR